MPLAQQPRFRRFVCLYAIAASFTLGISQTPAFAADPSRLSTAEVLANSTPGDWRALEPGRTLLMSLPGGPVVIELDPDFAPQHVENILRLVRAGYFDGVPVLRLQDNYVAQWGDSEKAKTYADASRKLPDEYQRPIASAPAFTALPDRDAYAPETGHSLGFPVSRDPARGSTWLSHCYGMVGVGRDNPPDNGSGAELYAVIGHAPRHLDRNIALVGRVVSGIERLSSLPRGTGELGFYETPAEYTALRSLRVVADLSPAERPTLEVLRTDTATWAAYVESRRSRHEGWFVEPIGRIELCNVAVPSRPAAPR